MNGQQETSMTSWCVFFRPINGCFFWDKVGEVQKKTAKPTNERPPRDVDDVILRCPRPINGRFLWDKVRSMTSWCRFFVQSTAVSSGTTVSLNEIENEEIREREREREKIDPSFWVTFSLVFSFFFAFFFTCGPFGLDLNVDQWGATRLVADAAGCHRRPLNPAPYAEDAQIKALSFFVAHSVSKSGMTLCVCLKPVESEGNLVEDPGTLCSAFVSSRSLIGCAGDQSGSPLRYRRLRRQSKRLPSTRVPSSDAWQP